MKQSFFITVQSKLNLSINTIEKMASSYLNEKDFIPISKEYKKLKKIKHTSSEKLTESIVALTCIFSDFSKTKHFSVQVYGNFLFTYIKGRFGPVKIILNTSLS